MKLQWPSAFGRHDRNARGDSIKVKREVRIIYGALAAARAYESAMTGSEKQEWAPAESVRASLKNVGSLIKSRSGEAPRCNFLVGESNRRSSGEDFLLHISSTKRALPSTS